MKSTCYLRTVLLFSLMLTGVLLFSCASVPTDAVLDMLPPTPAQQNQPPSAITVPDNVKSKVHTYFSYVSPEVMKDIENGSPASLRRAASALRRFNSGYEENDRVLLLICSNIMNMVWPQERVEWESPEVSSGTSYLGAINSARDGIYDTSTGNVDFLATALPSLVIVKVQDVSPFFEMSEASLKKCLEMSPDSVLINYLLGLLYKKNSMLDRALPYLNAAAAAAPECFQASYMNAECLFDAGKDFDAFAAVDSLVQKYPLNPAALKLAARVFYKKGDYDRAEEFISRLLQQDPNDLSALLFRARVLVEKKDFIHAASLLDVYARQDSTSKEYLLLRAHIQSDWSRNTTAAISTIETALKTYPSDKDVMLFAASLCSVTGLTVAGKNVTWYAAQVLEKDPSDAAARQFAVEGFISEKKWTDAYALSSSLVSSRSGDKAVLSNHIKICLKLKKYDEAWNLASEMYKNSPSDDTVIEQYVLVMVESGRSVQALTLINQLLGTASPHLKSFLYYERSFLQSSDETMLSDLRSSLMANPRNSDSLFRLYRIYYGRKDYRKAQYYLKQVVALNPNDSYYRSLSEELMNLLN